MAEAKAIPGTLAPPKRSVAVPPRRAKRPGRCPHTDPGSKLFRSLGNETLRRGNRDPHICKYRLLHHLGIVRANEQPRIQRLSQFDTGKLGRDKRRSESRA